jgi:hypothetical protein
LPQAGSSTHGFGGRTRYLRLGPRPEPRPAPIQHPPPRRRPRSSARGSTCRDGDRDAIRACARVLSEGPLGLDGSGRLVDHDLHGTARSLGHAHRAADDLLLRDRLEGRARCPSLLRLPSAPRPRRAFHIPHASLVSMASSSSRGIGRYPGGGRSKSRAERAPERTTSGTRRCRSAEDRSLGVWSPRAPAMDDVLPHRPHARPARGGSTGCGG